MLHRRTQLGAGQAQTAWPALLLIIVAVLTPTVCVLWFTSRAVQNEHLAVRQRLTEAYNAALQDARGRIEAYWSGKTNALALAQRGTASTRPEQDHPDAASHATDTQPVAPESSGLTFARLVKAGAPNRVRGRADYPWGRQERVPAPGNGVADSIIVYDTAGHVLYPNDAPRPPEPEAQDAAWQQARELEYELSRPREAAAAYAEIAARTPDPDAAARALLAQARCLAKAGQRTAAVDVLTRKLRDDRYRKARDEQGRLIRCNAGLLALQLLDAPAKSEFQAIAEALIEDVANYSDLSLPAGQRRFLMHELSSIVPGCPTFSTLEAEELAAEYLADNPPLPEPSRLTPSPRGDLWCLASPDRTLVALFHRAPALAAMQSLIDAAVPLPDVAVRLRPQTPRAETSQPIPFITLPAGSCLPGWQLALFFNGPDPFAAAARRQVVVYMWTAGIGILAIAAFGLLLARFVTHQMKLSRLKNDLVATVSHELKTPLASMRLLIDTLREGRCRDTQQASEYYGLIAKENERLTRLIDNFLTFSRMERNKRQFDFVELSPAEIITTAIESMRDRLAPPHCRLDVDIAADLPPIVGDRDALTTVLLNLLDNAYKYSTGDRHIAVRAYAADGHVCYEVRDNGVGLSRRAARKVFDRFYQVDQSLSRKVGGCGLGLSIVRFIVEAHSGIVAVVSEPGRGSTFTVTLPAATT